MRSFLANLAAAALLFHAFAGCCGQGLKSCADCCHLVQSGNRAEARGCSHDHDADDDHSAPHPSPPCKCQLECHSVCIALPPQKTVLDAAHDFTTFELAVINPSLPAGQAPTSADWERARVSVESGPPMRLHLLHQSLLI